MIMKVLHLPTDVGGNAWGLSRAERLVGLQSDVLTRERSNLAYPNGDIKLNLETISFRSARFLKLLSSFFRIRNKYDIFHFNYGTSLLHMAQHPFFYLLDLPFYPKKAKLFVTYNGCDARQKFPTMQRTPIAACHHENCYNGMCNSGKKDKERQKCIEKMSRYVKHMWALNPDLLYFLPPDKSSFLPYTVCSYEVGKYLPKLEKKLKIIHAPTNQVAKGSSYILEALYRLEKKYPEHLDILVIQNLPYQQAVEMYKQADLVIDQVLIGWYGAFAVETMLMGKPVIARISVEDLKFLPPQMANDLLQTVIQADPLTLYDVVERCLHDREFLKKRAEASIAYATKWHHPAYVASITKAKYEG